MDGAKETLRRLLGDGSDVGLVRLVAFLKALGPDGQRDQAAGAVLDQAWRELLVEPGLAPQVLGAVQRSGVLEGVVDPRVRVRVEALLSALGQARHAPAFDLLCRVWKEGEERELRVHAGLALLAFGDERALGVVAARLVEATGLELGLAVRAVFTRSPGAAWDELAPRFAKPSARGGAILQAALHALMMDLVDDGKAHWGRARGWYAADPRWRTLCEAWKALPPAEERERWGGSAVQEIVEVAGWLSKRQGP